jgi:conjugal transfer/type IV secretion protein DotA/TraY
MADKVLIRQYFSILLFIFMAIASVYSSPAFSNESTGGGIDVQQEVEGIFNYPVRIEGDNLEYAHLWMKQMLGGFIFAPWNQMGIDNGAYDANDITVLSKALGFTNVLSIILCLVIIYYMVVGGAINTATEGEVLGKQWNTPWLMIRTSVGFALITPLKVIGGMTMSFSQVAVIWLLMIGSNAASVLWTMVITEITQGTEIISPRFEIGAAKTADLFKMMVCTDSRIRSRTDDYFGDEPSGNGLTAGQKSQDVSDRKTIYVIDYTTGKPDRVLSSTGSGGGDYMWGNEDFQFDEGRIPTSFKFGPNGECGSIPFPVISADVTVDVTAGEYANFNESDNSLADDSRENSYLLGSEGVAALNYKSQAIQAGALAYARELVKIINDLQPALNELAGDDDDLFYGDVIDELTDSNPDVGSAGFKAYYNGYDHFKKAARRYAVDIVPAVHKEASGSPAVVQKMYDEMAYGGWAVAGLWFYEISALPGLTYNTVRTVHESIMPEAIDFCWIFTFWSNCSDMEEGAEKGYLIADMYLDRLTKDRDVDFTTPMDASSTICSDKGGCSGSGGATDRLAIYLARMLLGGLGDSPENANPMDDGGGLSSPFLFAAEIGHTMNYVGSSAILAHIATTAVVRTVADIRDPANGDIIDKVTGLVPGSKVKKFFFGLIQNSWTSALSVGASILVMIVMGAMSSGFLLAYVVPFMPVMTWIMMMAGYMLTVVEAIAAAPLAVVLLFTPEGQGIAGSRFERALQLVAMSILRPSFMVLGMLAGLTVSFVAFGMMNTFFFKAAEHVLSGTVFDIFAIVILYVSATYQLCKLMVESMHQLPDRIGEWFAGGVSRQFGESRIDGSAEASLGSLSSQMQSLPGAVVQAQKSALNTGQNSNSGER